MRQGLLFLVHVHRDQAYRVLVLRILRGASFQFLYLRVSLPDLKGRTRIYLFAGIDVCTVLVLLDQPVGEYFGVVVGDGCGTDGGRRQILVQEVVRRRACTVACVILYIDAVCADDLAAPARVQVQAVLDPGTLYIFVLT